MADYSQSSGGGAQGFRYETKMTALAALRLCSQADEFNLASNFDKAGKFDDIVFSARKGNTWSVWFVQLKHRQSTSLNKKKISLSSFQKGGSDFNLQKFFFSYKSISKKFSPGSDDPIFGIDVKRTNYVIFTNCILHDEILKRGHERVNANFLSTNDQVEYNIRFDLNKDKDIFEKSLRDWYISDFVNKLLFCSQQANEDDMDSLIQKEIKLIKPNLSSAEVKLVAHEWSAFIEKWSVSGTYLVKDDAMSTLSRLCSEAQHGKKNEISVKFLDNFLKFICDQLSSDDLVHYVSHADSAILCMAAFEQMLQMPPIDELTTIISLQNLNNDQERRYLLNVLSYSNSNRTLIVDCEVDMLSIKKDDIVNFIQRVKENYPSNRIILVSRKENAIAEDIAERLNAKRKKFNCSLKNLRYESKQMVKEQEVLFQGYKTRLASIMPHGNVMDDVLDMAWLSQIVQSRLVSVGIKPVEHIPYYVTRVLTRHSTVSETLFKNPDIRACFALTGIPFEQCALLSKSIVSSRNVFAISGRRLTEKIVVLEGNPDDDFEKLSKFPRVFHWFEKCQKAKLWRWKKSTGKIHDVSKNLERPREFVEASDIMLIKERVVVIIAEPGMGKSTLVNHLAAETKRCRPYIWVISLALNDFTTHLDNPDFLRNPDFHTKKLIASAAGVEEETSKFDARLFEQCYNVTGKMIVILDGFDEITPYYTEQGLAMLRALRRSAVARIWVTARPVLREQLENITSTLSFTIKPFVLKDQKIFLKKYWLNELPNIEPVRLDEFIDKVLELIEKSFDEKLHQFTGIPLQTSMVAEVFKEEITRFHETGDLILKERLNGVQLFEEFIRIKRIVQMDKSKGYANAISRFDQKQLDDAREKDLMNMALLTLLPLSSCANLHPAVKEEDIRILQEKVTEGYEKTGIVLSFKGETPHFIHRTFAEYFVALFFIKNFEMNRNFLSSDEFFSPPFEFVRYFFNRILAAGCKLHEAVLEQDMDSISDELPVDDSDGGGRTALHVAAALPESEAVINMLLDAGADVGIEDHVLGWKPMQYAAKIRSVGNLAILLEHSEGTFDNGIVPINWETLRLAVQGDYLKLLLHLLENGIYAEENLDEISPQKWIGDTVQEGLTLLHLAAAYDAEKILRYLLRNGTRDCKLKFIECPNTEGMTPLLQAAARGHLVAACVLMAAGANYLVETRDGKNLCQIAAEAQDIKMLLVAIAKAQMGGADLNVLLSKTLTVLIGDNSDWGAKTFSHLLDFYPSLEKAKTSKNMPLLAAAAIKGNEQVVKQLCKLDTDVNEMTAHGTPLHLAVSGGHDLVVKELLTCPRTLIDVPDLSGCTPLYRAVIRGDATIFKILIDAKANINCLTNDGSNLSHAVAISLDQTIFKYLHEKKYNFCTENSKKETGLSLLKAANAVSFVQVLEPEYLAHIKMGDEKHPSGRDTVGKKSKKKPKTGPANSLLQDTAALLELLRELEISKPGGDEINTKVRELVGVISKENTSESEFYPVRPAPKNEESSHNVIEVTKPSSQTGTAKAISDIPPLLPPGTYMASGSSINAESLTRHFPHKRGQFGNQGRGRNTGLFPTPNLPAYNGNEPFAGSPEWSLGETFSGSSNINPSSFRHQGVRRPMRGGRGSCSSRGNRGNWSAGANPVQHRPYQNDPNSRPNVKQNSPQTRQFQPKNNKPYKQNGEKQNWVKKERPSYVQNDRPNYVQKAKPADRQNHVQQERPNGQKYIPNVRPADRQKNFQKERPTNRPNYVQNNGPFKNKENFPAPDQGDASQKGRNGQKNEDKNNCVVQ